MRRAWVSWQMFVHDMATGKRMNDLATAGFVIAVVALSLASLIGLKVPILGK